LMRGEHVVGREKAVKKRKRLAPGGGGGGCWLGGPRTESSEKWTGHQAQTERLTWVAGDRPEGELDDVSRKILAAQPQSGPSIFDPVLCELVYRWFCPLGGTVLDPFAGGSVRGIVASKLGRPYVGVDLRPEQIAANREQAARICDHPQPVWHVGDSR